MLGFKERGAFALTIDVEVTINVLLSAPASLPLEGSMADTMHLEQDEYRHVELLTGDVRRRRWTTEQKLTIIEHIVLHVGAPE